VQFSSKPSPWIPRKAFPAQGVGLLDYAQVRPLKATRNVIGYGDAVSKIARRKLEKETRDEEGEGGS
jgi:hypothetical protein